MDKVCKSLNLKTFCVVSTCVVSYFSKLNVVSMLAFFSKYFSYFECMYVNMQCFANDTRS